MSDWISLADVVGRLRPPLSDEERRDIGRLMIEISQATIVAQSMPTTLDAHVRGLVVMKLQEAEHWSLELLRAASLEREPSP